MPTPFEYVWNPSGGFNPASRLTGNRSNSVYAGLNMVLISDGQEAYFEQWPGYGLFAVDGNNTIATGSVNATIGTNTVTGVGTKFRTELMEGQSIAISGRIYVPTRIDSETSMQVTPPLHANIVGGVVAILRQIQELDNVICSMERGGVIRLPRGHLLGLGRGAVRINGAVLAGGGWTLTDQPQIAVYSPVTQQYTPYRLGMVTPTLTTVTAIVGGGTKGMPAADYSVRIVPYKFATEGHNLPSDPVMVTLAAAGDPIQVTFPAMDTANGQDGWRVYGTRSDTAAGKAMMGPWYLVRTLTSTEVPAAGGTFTLEWTDGELTELLEYNNDPPRPAAFLASLGGLPLLLGSDGQGRQLTGTAATINGDNTITGTGSLFTTELGLRRFVWIGTGVYKITRIDSPTSMEVDPAPTATAGPLSIYSAESIPGPVVQCANISGTSGGFNFDGYSAEAATAIDPPSSILGCYATRSRVYCLTANTLAFVERNEDPSTSSIKPIVPRPHWNIGFRNSRALVAVNGYLYAFTTNGATRSAEYGDKVETEHSFAAAVTPVMALWDSAKVTVAYSAEYEAVCFIHADDGTRPGGTARYGTALCYGLRTQAWFTPLRMEDLSDVNPTYGTSTATLGGKLFFASPSNAGVTRIYQFAVPGGTVGETFLAPTLTDMGASGRDKNIRFIRATAGRNNSAPAVLDIYGTGVDEAAPVADLNAGTNSKGQVSFTLNTPVVTTSSKKVAINRLQTFTPRIRFATSGNVGARCDEIAIEGNVSKVRR